MADAESNDTEEMAKATAMKALAAALGNANVPKVYFNQFFTFVGAHDVTLLAGVNGVPRGVLSMSYPMAKTLANSLTEAVANYEKDVKVQVPDAAKLENAIKALPGAIDIK